MPASQASATEFESGLNARFSVILAVMDITDLLDSLNDAQRRAVCSESPNQLVLAGAGSGKTRVLTHRMAWLIRCGLASPHSIMAVTFTNKAAQEMRHRLAQLLEQPVESLWVGTFHGIAHRLLRQHWQESGLQREFQILDSDDQLRLVKRSLRELEIDEEKWPAKPMQWFINQQKEEGLRPDRVEVGNDLARQQSLRVYAHYQSLCQQQSVVDFAELLLRADELWQRHPDLLRHYQQRLTHLLIDEFQDTNTIQYRWIRHLAGQALGVMAVGDDDQSIYGWRGARIENLHRYSNDFTACELIRLEQNYRSSGHILAAANHLIACNQERLGKTLWTEAGEGEPLQLYAAFNDLEEARFIVAQIQSWQQEGIALNEMAILYRSNAQSRLLEEALLYQALPYRIYGGLRFFERAEVKDALAYLHLASNRHDDTAFERIVNHPPRGIGAKTLEGIQQRAQHHRCSRWQALEQMLQERQLPARAELALQRFVTLIQQLAQPLEPTSDLGQRVKTVIEQAGLNDYWSREKGEKGQSRLENLQELAVAARQFTAEWSGDPLEPTPLQQFLAHAALEAGAMQADESQPAVQLMTLHSAKGLEFPCVVLAGLEEGLFPHQMSLSEAGRLEEERRLCYVGLTRARRHLLLTYAELRRLYGEERYNRPSRFLREIPPQHIRAVGVRGRVSRPLFAPATATAAPPTSPRPAAGAASPPPSYQSGDLVMHAQLGEGKIVQIEGSGDRQRLQIEFKRHGTKWFIAAVAPLGKL